MPIANRIVHDLDHSRQSNKPASVLLVTIWELGEAAGPLLIGPLSEIVGRHKVINVANGCFVLAVVMAACANSVHLMIAARALNGFAVAANVLNPAIIGDIFEPERRGTAISLTLLASMVGGAIGPVIAGAVTETMGWRYVLWIATVLALLCEVAFLVFFRETYKVTILQRKVKDQREGFRQHDRAAALGRADKNNSLSTSVLRPLHMILHSGILLSISFYGAYTFTFYYIMVTTLPDVLQDGYGLASAKTGLSFLALSIGSSVSVLICNVLLDRIYVVLKRRYGTPGMPEYRLPLVIVGAFTLPSMIIFYGWAVERHLPLPVILLAVGSVGSLILFAYLPLMSYIVDAFGVYSASALTASIVLRCLAGTFLPLTAKPLIERFNYGWAFTFLGGLAVAFSPIPISLYVYGDRWRARSKYSE